PIESLKSSDAHSRIHQHILNLLRPHHDHVPLRRSQLSGKQNREQPKYQQGFSAFNDMHCTCDVTRHPLLRLTELAFPRHPDRAARALTFSYCRAKANAVSASDVFPRKYPPPPAAITMNCLPELFPR